jgi:Arc/MetJ family transcription regulator
MRTNIEIDDDLMAEVMARSGAKTKREAVETALRELLQSHIKRAAYESLRALRGKVQWEGDLDAMRRDKPDSPWL